MLLLDYAINEKCCSVDGGRGFNSSRVPTPGNLPSKAKKVLMHGGQPAGGGVGEGTERSWN